MKWYASLTTAVLLAVTASLVSGHALAQGEPPPDPIVQIKSTGWRWPQTLQDSLVRTSSSTVQPGASSLPPNASGAGPVTGAGSNQQYWWLAFQSFRDGNFEIYLGSSPPSTKYAQRLTFDQHADVEPTLNPGAGQIAFVSLRDGNAEIYRMDTDGSHLKRLTSNPADDAMPIWSGVTGPHHPGSLYFVSERDGNPEIYHMDADGGAVQRLTYDGAADIYPAPAPDGSRLAWIRYQGQYGAIWVMNSDGSNAHPLSPNLRFLSHLKWSPAGDRFMFDYDADGDGWNRVGLMNVDGTGLRTFICTTYYPVADVWAGDWTPDGKALYATAVLVDPRTMAVLTAYIQYQNTNTCNTFSDDFRLVDLLPSVADADPWPPVSRVDPLPPYTRDFNLSVRVTAMDIGRSALIEEFLQFRPSYSDGWNNGELYGDSVWHRVVQLPVGRVYFRSSAKDQAENREPWPADPTGDASTISYHRKLSGVLTDSRGNPIGNRLLDVRPTPVTPAVTALDGSFDIRVGDTGVYQVQRSAIITLTEDRSRAFYALPSVDILENGGFEAESLAGWEAGGNAAVVLNQSTVHSGRRAVRFGPECTGPCAFPHTAYTGQALEDAGTPLDLLSATDTQGGEHEIYYLDESLPGFDSLIYRYRAPNGSWTVPEKISDAYEVARFGRGGKAHALVAAPDGTVHILWAKPLGTRDFLLNFQLYHKIRYADGSWSPALGMTMVGPSMDQATAVADQSSRIHLIWNDGSDRYYSVSGEDDTWSEPEVLGGLFLSSVQGSGGVPPAKGIYAAGPDPKNNRIIYRYRSTASGWSDPLTYPSAPGGTTPVADAQTGTLRQVVVIPAELRHPTLAFMYSMHGGITGSSSFTVDVTMQTSGELTSTNVFSSSITTPWVLGWADMTPWAGQQVVVTFALKQAAGDMPVRVDLDEVSLGEWASPVVTGVEGVERALMPGSTILIHGENFTPAARVLLGDQPLDDVRWISENELQAMLMSSLPSGYYVLTVENDGGNRSAYGRLVSVGQQIFVPVVLRN